MKAQLAYCNKCAIILYDENPDDQPKLWAPENTRQMKRYKDENGHFWGCPECEDDGCLEDVTLEKYTQITTLDYL